MTILDTHEAIETMISSGVPKKHAEGIIKAFKSNNKDLATKYDIELIKKDISNLKEQMATKSDLEKLQYNMNSNNEKLRYEMQSMSADIKKEHKIILVVGTTIISGMFIALITSPNVSNFFHGILA